MDEETEILLKKLDEEAGSGLDLSPGNSLCAQAAAKIRELLDIIRQRDKYIQEFTCNIKKE